MGRKKAPLGPLIDEVFEEYLRLRRERYGPAAMKMNGRGRTRTREVIEAIGFNEVKLRLQVYFRDDDKWVCDRSHPYNVFLSRVDDYAAKARRLKHGKARDAARDGIARHDAFDPKKYLDEKARRRKRDR